LAPPYWHFLGATWAVLFTLPLAAG